MLQLDGGGLFFAVAEVVIAHLLRSGRVAVMADDQEVSPSNVAAIPGMSRPLVVHRMEVGDLPFHHVGKHRLAKLNNVLALKERIDGQRAAPAALAEDTEGLIRNHGLQAASRGLRRFTRRTHWSG